MTASRTDLAVARCGDPAAAMRRLMALIDEAVAGALPTAALGGADGFGVDRLVESMRYSLGTPGKRIRPLLLLAAAETVGADAARLARFGAGLEMIHAYSLIHDDLPAMDDDDLRRGFPTNHVVYGQGMAILAGDGLLSEAFVLMLEPVAEAALQLRVVQEVARASGRDGMVGGQAADLMGEGRAPDPALLRAIHARKTGALLRVSVRAGAMLAGATPAQLAAICSFGELFGLAFQIADDIKDEVAPPQLTGKLGGGDRLAGKMTYPSLFGIDGSRELLIAQLEAARRALRAVGRDTALLDAIACDAVAPALAGGAAEG
ncbi:MAG: polyprenyl synthetase family protein [Deltaproteobacteria bacterium]|nr:polyprenyl synthetase family protein [Deltaproteobacteria bacterium]